MKLLHIYFNDVELRDGAIYGHIKGLSYVQSGIFGFTVYVLGFTAKESKEKIIRYHGAFVSLMPRYRGLLGRVVDLVRIYGRALNLITALHPEVVELHHWQLSFISPIVKVMKRDVRIVQKYYGTLLAHYLERKDIVRLIFKALELLSFKMPNDLVIMLDDGTMGYRILRYLRVPSRRFRIVRNTYYDDAIPRNVDSEEAKRMLFSRSDIILVSYIARLDWWKRHDRFIKTAIKTLRIYDGIRPLRFIVVGSGPLLKHYKNIVEKHGYGEYIMFVGSVDRHTLMTILAATDIHMALYDFSCVGHATLEAMAAGKCTIVCDSGDTSKLLRGGAAVVPCDEIDATAAALHQYIVNEKERAELGKKAGTFVSQNFPSWKEYWHKNTQWILSLIQDPKKT